MSGRNLQDYVEVRDRIEKFWADHPEGRILPEMLIANEQIVRFRVDVYTDRDDPRPASVGHAEEVRSEKGVNATSAVENCETSAIGRALANLGMHLSKHRASREEMHKVERMERGTASAGFEEGERVVDAPIAMKRTNNAPVPPQRAQQAPPPTPVALTEPQNKAIADAWDMAEAKDTYNVVAAQIRTMEGTASPEQWAEIKRRFVAIRRKHFADSLKQLPEEATR